MLKIDLLLSILHIDNLLYCLFDWPHHANAKIVMCGIANTMDFPERLQKKIASRIGNSRIVYKQYSRYINYKEYFYLLPILKYFVLFLLNLSA